MESKYYVPDISEFYSGFIYEYLDYKDKWIGSSEFTNDWDWEDNPHYAVIKAIDANKIRCKYLDESDILSLGFKLYEYNKPYGIYVLQLGEEFGFQILTLEYCERRKLVKILKKDKDCGFSPSECLFLGVINNKSELAKILKQVWKNL